MSIGLRDIATSPQDAETSQLEYQTSAPVTSYASRIARFTRFSISGILK